MPDGAGGLQFWQNQMAGGLTRDAVLLGFMHSAEFQAFMDAHVGSTGQRAEVDLLMAGYRAAFIRLPDNAR